MVDLFFLLNKINTADRADDNTPYTSSNEVNGLIKSLEEASKELMKWFDDSLMKSNPEKCHLLVSTNDNVAIRIRNFWIENTKVEKLLGIQFDIKLSFGYDLSEICKKASKKLYAVGTATPYMKLPKRKLLINAFFNSQFSYYPLMWMCQSLNRLCERCLRIIYGDKQWSFEGLLEKDSSVYIHERNIQILTTKMYRASKGMSPPQITELFARRNEHLYNVRVTSNFYNHL